MSYEPAAGKNDKREIEYLTASGLDKKSAISTVICGFLNVDIEGLPPALKQKLDQTVFETQKGIM